MLNSDKIYQDKIEPIESDLKGIIGNQLKNIEDREDAFQDVCVRVLEKPWLSHKQIRIICLGIAKNLKKRRNWERRYFVNFEDLENFLSEY